MAAIGFGLNALTHFIVELHGECTIGDIYHRTLWNNKIAVFDRILYWI